MRTRTVLAGGFACLLFAATVSAVNWEEVGSGAAIVTDGATGSPAVVFSVELAFDERPSQMQLQFSWEVYVLDGKAETVLDELTRTSRQTRATDHVWTASSPVMIEAVKRYGARVEIKDLVNGLTFRKTLSYFAPLALSVGIRLTGDTGAQLFDMTGVPDAELAELAELGRAISGYEILGESVALTSLFSQHATSDDAFPVSVLIMPDTGIDSHGGTSDVTITLRFGLQALVYSVEDHASAASFLNQIAEWDETFTGTVYAGPGSNGFGKGFIVFVHDAVQPILDAAQHGGD